METTHPQSVSHPHEPVFSTKPIWRTFWILLIITMIELTLAFIHLYTGFPPKFLLNGIYLILTVTKAFYIVAEFMHLRHEIKNMIMTVVVPLLLFGWFVTAFLWDGNAYRNNRNTYDPYKRDQSHVKVHEHGEKANEAKQPGSIE